MLKSSKAFLQIGSQVLMLILTLANFACTRNQGTNSDTNRVPSPNNSDNPHFRVSETKNENGIYKVSVVSDVELSTLEQSVLIDFARSVVEEHKSNPLIRCFFYNPSDKISTDGALALIEWTESDGLVVMYDRSRPREVLNVETDFKIPEYTILDDTAMITGGHYGDILIPSLTPDSPESELGDIAKAIAQKEGFTQIAMYCLEDAYHANMSGSFAESHPTALKDGYLGSYANGVFTPSLWK